MIRLWVLMCFLALLWVWSVALMMGLDRPVPQPLADYARAIGRVLPWYSLPDPPRPPPLAERPPWTGTHFQWAQRPDEPLVSPDVIQRTMQDLHWEVSP